MVIVEVVGFFPSSDCSNYVQPDVISISFLFGETSLTVRPEMVELGVMTCTSAKTQLVPNVLRLYIMDMMPMHVG